MNTFPRKIQKRSRLAPHFIKRLSSWLVLSTSLTVVLSKALTVDAEAASGSWLGTADSTWAGANWSASPAPGTGDTATFNGVGNANTIIDLGGGVTVNTILFDTASAAAYTIGSGAVSSQTLTLNNGGAVTMNATVAANQLFNAAMVLGTDATAQSYAFTNNSTTNSLTFAGNISGGTGGTAGSKVLTVTGSGETIISGNIANGGASGIALTKTGAGTLTLSGTNTYTGLTAINAGTVKLGSSTALGSSATTSYTTVGAGGTLDLNGRTIAEAFGTAATSGDGFGGATAILTNSDTVNAASITGTINFDGTGAFTVNGAGDIALTRVSRTFGSSGTVTITKDGAGTLTLAGSGSTNSGTAVTVNNGVVVLNKTTSGTVRALEAASTVNSGGTLRLAGSGGNQILDSTDLTLTGTGIFDLNGRSETINSLTVSATGTVKNTAASTTSVLTVGSSNGNTTVSGVVENGAGTTALTKIGTGTLTLSNSNTYTGDTVVTLGSLALDFLAAGGGNDNLLAASTALKLGNSSTDRTVTLTLTGDASVTNNQTVNGLSFTTANRHRVVLTSGASGTVNLSVGALGFTAGGYVDFVLPASGAITTSSADAVLSPTITLNNGASYARISSGALTAFTGDLVYATATNISALVGYTATSNLTVDGTSTGNVIQTAGPTDLNTVSVTDAASRTLTVGAGNTLQLGAPGGILRSGTAGSVIVGEGGNAGELTAGTGAGADLILTNGNATGTLTVNSVIKNNAGGAVDLVVNGASGATTILAGANTYTGATVIQAGALRVTNNTGLGTTAGGVSVIDGAALELSGGITVGNEALSIIGTGVGSNGALRNVSGTNTYTGLVTLTSNAEIQAETGSTLIFNRSGTATAVTTTAPITFDTVGTATMIFDDALELTGSLNPTISKTGGGTLILNASNTFAGTGTFTIDDGVVRAANSGALGTSGGSTLIDDSAALELTGSITIADGITIDDGSTGIANGGAIRSISGANIISGTVTIDDGTGRITADSGASLALTNATTAIQTESGGGRTANFGGAGDITIGGGGAKNNSAPQTLTLTKDGTGTLTMSSTGNSYTGSTTISAGTLVLSGTISASAITIAAPATFNEGSTGILSGTASLTTAGTTTLSGTNTTTGATSVTGGTLTLNYDTGASGTDTNKLADGAILTLGGSSAVVIAAGASGSHSETVLSTTLSAGAAITIGRTGAGTAVLNLNAVTVGAGASVNFTAASIATTDNLNTSGILGGWATVTTGGATEWATNSTNAANGLITAFTTTDTDINRLGGVVPNTAASNVRIVNGGASGNITLAATPLNRINTLRMEASDGAATIDPANNADVFMIGGDAGGGIVQTATAGPLTVGTATGDGVLTTGGTANTTPATLAFINNSPGSDLTINSIIANNGTDVVGFSKLGAGRVVVNGANTFTGGVSIGEGILQIGALSGASTTATLGASTVVTNNGSLVFRRTSTGAVDLAGAIGGTGSVAYVGSGTSLEADYTVNSASTYSGATTITNARATLTVATGLGTGAVTINSGGSVFVNAGITVANNLTIAGNGWLETMGNLGAIRLSNNAAVISGTVTLAGDSRITASTSTTGTISGVIGGNFDLEFGEGDAAGTLVLSGNNTFGGDSTILAGVVQANHNSALSGGTVTFNGGTRLALGNGVTVGNAIIIGANTGASGNGLIQSTAGIGTVTGPITINNNATAGGHFGATGGSTLLVNSVITSSVTVVSRLGNVVFSGGGTGYTALSISQDTTSIGANDGIATTAVVDVAASAGFDLNGFNQTLAGLQRATVSPATVTNTGGTASTLTLNVASPNSYTYGGDITGNINLVKAGAGTETFSGTIGYTGSTTVSAGTLNLSGTIATPTAFTTLTVNGGATLSFIGGAGVPLTSLTTLSLGTGAGTTTLGLELGTASDLLGLTGTATTANAVQFNFSAVTGFGAGTYNLISATGGLSGATYAISTAPGGFTYSFTNSDSLVQLNVAALAAGNLYWKGAVNNSWSAFSGVYSNFTPDALGTNNAQGAPGSANTVVFSADGQTATSLITTLDNSFSIRDLVFSNNTGSGPLNSITIDPGTGTHTLTLTPVSSAQGIDVQTGAPADVTISVPAVLGGDQTWTVAAAGSTLTASGAISGAATESLSKAGAGTLVLSSSTGNSFTGGLTISAGTVNFSAANQLGGLGNIVTLDGGTLNLTTTTGIVNLANAINVGASGGTLNLSGTGTAGKLFNNGVANLITGSGTLTKMGGADLQLNSSNSFSGAWNVNGGYVEVQHVNALGDDSAGNVVTVNNGGELVASNSIALPQDLTLNTGAVISTNVTGSSFAGNINASGDFSIALRQFQTPATATNLTISGPLSGAGNASVTAPAAASLTLTGNNSSWTGDLALGTNTTAIFNTGTSYTYSGDISGAGAVTKTGANTLTLSGAHTHTGNTTVSQGVLDLTGTITSNNTTSTLVYNPAAGITAVVNVSGGTQASPSLFFSMQGGITAGGIAVYNQTGGYVSIAPATAQATSSTHYISNAGYGYFNLTGGTYKIGSPTATARFNLSGTSGGAVGQGVVYIGGVLSGGSITGGGTLDQTNAEWMLNYGTASVTVATGGTINRVGAASNFGITMNATPANGAFTDGTNGAYGILNMAGGTLLNSNRAIVFGNGTIANSAGFMNLAAGTLSTGVGITINNGTTAGSNNNVYFNFAGGTITTTASVAAILPAAPVGTAVTTTLFGPITNNNSGSATFNTQVGTTQNFVGGATINVASSFTSGLANALLAATGYGVTQPDITIPVTGNSGYVGAPLVAFSTPSGGGVPASGYAVLSGDQVTGIVITNPGTYASGEVVTIRLTGGGGAIASSFTTAALGTANTSGGLTKTGNGTLTLSGASTFTAPLTISAGILASATFNNIGVTGPLGAGIATDAATNAASIVLNGGTLSYTGTTVATTDRRFTLTTNGGGLDASGTTTNTLTFSDTAAIALSGTGTRTLTFGGSNTSTNVFHGRIIDDGANATTIGKIGASTWSLMNALNSYTGGTNLGGGVLSFASNALSNTGDITFTGNSTLRWNGHLDDLSSRLVLTAGVIGTIDNPTGTLVFANAVDTTGGTTGILNKAGAGALTLNAAANHTGGTTLTAGTLNIGHLSALGTGTFTIAGPGIFDNTTGSAGTLAGDIAQAWNADFTFTGTSSLNLGAGAVTLGAARAVTVSANTLTVDGPVGGLFALTKNGAGTLHLGGNNTFGAVTGSVVTINGGVVKIDDESGLGNVLNDVTFANGATLQVTTGFTANTGKVFTVSAPGGGTIQVDSGTLTLGNALVGVAGTGGLIKKGAGTLALTVSSSSYDAIGVGVNGATTAGFRVDAGTLLLQGTSNSVVGDLNPNTMQVQLNGGHLTIQTDTASIARANLYVSNVATLTADRATAGPGITQVIGTLVGDQLTMGTGSSTLNIVGGANVTSGTEIVQFGATNLLAAPIFNITNPTGATTQLTLGAVAGNAFTITLTGNGNFTQTGVITSTGGFTVSGTYSGLATLSQVNAYSGLTTVNGGTLAFAAATDLGNLSATNDITLGGGTLRYTGAGTVNLNANRQLNLTTGTTSTIEVASITGILQVTGGIVTAGAGSLVKTGTGLLSVTGPVNLNGGSVTVSDGTLTAGFTATGANAITISDTGSLQLVDNSASTLTLGTGANALTLNGGARVGLELDASGLNDQIFVGSGGTAFTNGGIITLDFYALTNFGAGTYNLLQADSGLLQGGVNYVLGTAPSGFNYVITQTDTLVSLQTSVLSNRYWTGSQSSTSWNTITAGPLSNFSTDSAGAANSTTVPGSADTVIFSASSVAGTALATTLDAAFAIDSLQFNNVPAGILTVSIGSGTGGTSSTLTLTPVSTTNGILVASGGGAVTIGAPVIVGAPQTWFVHGTGASSLTITGDVTFTNRVTKTGAGALTLNGNNSGGGGLTLTGGTLNINSATALGIGLLSIGVGTTIDNSSAGTLTLSSNNAHAWNGSFAFTGTQHLNLGTGNVTLGTDITLTATANTLTVGGIIDDGSESFALTKSGAGVLALDGLNTYQGGTNLAAGTLILGNKGAVGTGVFTVTGTSTLQTAANLTGVNKLANNVVLGGTLTINGSNSLEIGGTTTTSGANRVLTNNLTGPAALTFTGNVILGEATGARNLNAGGSGSTFINGVVANGPVAGGWLVKQGTGTLTLGAANTYSGYTIIDQGTLSLAAGVNQSMTNRFYFGSSTSVTSAGIFDLSNASATFTVAGDVFINQINSTTNTPSIVIGLGQSLNLNGNVRIGSDAAGSTTTLMTASGLGTINVTNAASTASFRVGGYATSITGEGNRASADLSGLAALNISLNTASGIVAVSSSGTPNTANKYATLILAATTNITAKTLSVGDGGSLADGSTGVNTLKLGSVVTNINVDTINVGTGQRDFGSVSFYTGAGTVVVRNAAGNGRAALNIGTTGGGTSVLSGTLQNTFDVTGHSADLLLGAVTIGAQNRGDAVVSSFSFNQGTLDMTSLTLATRGVASTNGAHSTTSTVNLGGGDVAIQNGVLQMAQSTAVPTGTGGATTTSATINVTGGTVAIGNTSGTSITMASAVASTFAAATLNLTGGTTTLTGNIVKTGGAGTTSATVTLNGISASSAVLDMGSGGHSIGSAANSITFNAQQGTLRNLSELNGGGTLTKTTAGTLLLNTSNAYTGLTSVSAGVLQITHGSALGGITNGTSVTANAALEISNNITTTAEALTLNGTGVSNGGVLRNTSGANTYTGAITLGSNVRINSNTGTLTLDVASGDGISGAFGLTFGGAGHVTVNDAIATGANAVTKDGAGTLTLAATNSYTGLTDVTDGTVIVSGSIAGDAQVAAGATLIANGTIGGNVTSSGLVAGSGTISGALTVSGGTTEVRPGTSPGILTVGSLDASGATTGAKLALQIAGTTAGTGHDQLVVTGAAPVNLGTQYNLELDSTGYTFNGAHPGDLFAIIVQGTGVAAVTTTFANQQNNVLFDFGTFNVITALNGQQFAITYGGDYTGNVASFSGGNDVLLMAIPEPNSLAMLAGSLGLALGLQRFRRPGRRMSA